MNRDIRVSRGKEALIAARRLLDKAIKGFAKGQVELQTVSSMTKASGTVTAASVQAADTVTIAGVELTAHASTQNTTTFALGASNTECAANLATCINANTTINKYVSATSSGAVVTITALEPGVLGNLVSLATSDNTRLAKSATALAGGTGNTDTSALTVSV